ncbi:MAG: YpmS family protein [Streptococcaceae bacterium]|nr:YpmS family protein [Streptococcaceae bacterium]
MEKRKINLWMISTLFLLALILGTATFVFTRITSVREPELSSKVEEVQKVKEIAQIQTNKERLNAVINNELKKQQKGNMKYSFYLDKQAVFVGEYEIFGSKIPFYAYFSPKVLPNGNVLLSVKSVSAGTLSLPVSTILSFMNSSLKLPNYVEMNSKKGELTIRLDKLNVGGRIFLKAKMIDIVNDKFIFDIQSR